MSRRMGSKSWKNEEVEMLTTRVAEKVRFEEMLPEFPGRTIWALKRKASELGLRYRRETNVKNKSRNMAMFMRPLTFEETHPTAEQDKAFQVAMALAVANGLETAPHGVVTEPCTQYPKLVRAESIVPRSSPAGDCADLGAKGGHFLTA